MRSSILHLLSLFLVVSFAASCGKKDSSSSSSNANPLNSSGAFSASGAQAQANLLAWSNSTVEGTFPSVSVYLARTVTIKTRIFSPSSNGCNQQPISVFGLNLGNINICVNNSISGTTTYPQSMVTMVLSGSKLTGNPKLVSALAPLITSGADGLTLSSISQTPSNQSSGSVFVIEYKNSAGKSIVQVIDTGMNSALNPVYMLDGVNGKETSLQTIHNL
jgi:hypothetical protein